MLDIRDFGLADPTGTQDSWHALQGAIDAMASGAPGGPVVVPAGVFRINSQITIPPVSLGLTYQRAVRIIGASAGGSVAAFGAPSNIGGSILDMRYGAVRQVSGCSVTISGGVATLSTTSSFLSSDVGLFVAAMGIPSGTTILSYVDSMHVTLSNADSTQYNTPTPPFSVTLNAPKILATLSGVLGIENLTLMDGGTDTAPFIQSIGTVLRIRGVQFYGNHTNFNRIVPTPALPPSPPPPPVASVSASSKLVTFQTSTPMSSGDVGAAIFSWSGDYPNTSAWGAPVDTYVSAVDIPNLHYAMSRNATVSTTTNVRLVLVATAQDAIVLGGPPASGSGTNAGFSGYGTVIEQCFFYFIRRALYARAIGNAVVFRDNWIGGTCGAGYSYEAAVDLDGPLYGGMIAGNVIEMSYYTNGIRLNDANHVTVCGNWEDDATLAGIPASACMMTGISFNNVVAGGMFGGALVDQSGGANTVITPTPLLGYPAPAQYQNKPPNFPYAVWPPAQSILPGPMATAQSSAAQSVSNGITISTASLSIARVTTTSPVTGAILQPGIFPAQQVWVVNESGNTIQFAVSGSNVADGNASSIPANASRQFVWDSATSLWYRAA